MSERKKSFPNSPILAYNFCEREHLPSFAELITESIGSRTATGLFHPVSRFL